MRIAVVMSGGRGKRFWPLSRKKRPKQLIRILNGKTLLELTLERLAPLFDASNTLIVTQQQQVPLTRQIAGGLGEVTILAEPVGRNTAPCIAFAASYVRAAHGDGVLALVPADHFIGDVEAFRRVMAAGLDFVERTGTLLTIGIRPDRPATGFGYIEVGDEVGSVEGHDFFKVKAFREKPSQETAISYLESGRHLWNAGIFVFKASAIMEEIGRHLPAMAEEFERCAGRFGTPDEAESLARCYAAVEDISIDYGVMEKTDKACVVPADIGWDDVGNWESFSKYMERDPLGNAVRGTHVTVDSRDCVVYSEKAVVATAGLEGIAVIATDDAILIVRKEKSEQVKDLVNKIENNGLFEIL